MFDDILTIEIPAVDAADGEREIARLMVTGMTRFDALLLLRNSTASIIAEDAVLGAKQWQPRLNRYAWAEQQIEAESAAIVPGLAEHTAAAQDEDYDPDRSRRMDGFKPGSDMTGWTEIGATDAPPIDRKSVV